MHEYSPAEFTMMSTLLVPPVGVALNTSPLGGSTAYTIVAGELPVVMYVASKVVASPDFTLLVKASMVALLPSTLWAILVASFTIPQPVSADALSTRTTVTALDVRCTDRVYGPPPRIPCFSGLGAPVAATRPRVTGTSLSPPRPRGTSVGMRWAMSAPGVGSAA